MDLSRLILSNFRHANREGCQCVRHFAPPYALLRFLNGGSHSHDPIGHPAWFHSSIRVKASLDHFFPAALAGLLVAYLEA